MTALTVIRNLIILFFYSLISITGTKAQLVADFTGNPLSGCAPLIVHFTDQSQGNPTQWKWYLGNSTISFLQNPSATYFNPGTYNIKLVIQNAAGTADSITKTQFVTVYSQPSVDFIGNPLAGCYPLPVQFTDQSIPGDGSINLWQWDFGDGTLATIQNPTHTYTNAGNFNVSLRVRNSVGCIKVLTRNQYVQISTGVHADFSNDQPSNCSLPATINFQNLSTGTGVLNYQWDFGDGGTSTLTNPSHTYLAIGSFTVRLIVTNAAGCTDTLTRNNVITIGIVNAAFSSPDTVCQNSPLAFTNTSSPIPSSVAWDFGDGTISALLNPSKTYTTAGTYLVRMIALFGACADTAYKTITVLPQPTVGFTANPTISCSLPFIVNFTNTSTGAVSYLWNFGDASSSTSANPVHTYTSFGNFTVTLVATNSNGCSKSLTIPSLVQIQAPQAIINNLTDEDCAPLTHTFTATINSLFPVTSYLWDFGDGNTSTLPNPTHVFPTGSYNIKLIITTAGGCSDTVLVPNGIIANERPIANFVATPLNACAKIPINFTNLSSVGVTSWLWDFGDGMTSNDPNPIHLYQDTGFFTIQLIVWNNGCPDTISFVDYIHILPPIASFTETFDCINPKQRIFTDHSIGADEWLWDFGDGTTSIIPSPIHLYADTGFYTITLTVINHTTGCDYTTTQTAHVIIEHANFNVTDTVICRNNSIGFTAFGSNTSHIATYAWNFGDGATGSGINTTHTYTLAGTYDIRLITLDINGCLDTISKPLHIRVNGPTAAFSPSVPGSCLLSTVIFNDQSINDGVHPILTWIWNFGDGSIDTLHAAPFQHTYSTPGAYTVSLKLIDGVGCVDSINHNSAIIISHPVAGFNSTDTLSCPNRPVQFNNTSTGPGLNYTWYFGDGSISHAANPVHNYSMDGNYTIKLVIVDQYGCTDSLERSSYVIVITPAANFIMSDSISTCPPLIVNFTNLSTGYLTVNWDFGDGSFASMDNPSHFYSTPGIFNVRLTVTGPGGCSAVLTKQIIIRGPRGSFSYTPLTGCDPLQVHLFATTQDRVSFVWDFSDGNILATNDSNLVHTYLSPGIYVPKMILVDAGGCQIPITGVDTIKVNGVEANFDALGTIHCDAGTVSFTNNSLSNDVIQGYNWYFGDGGSSTLQNPSHFYPAPGLYYPKLIVTTLTGCIDSIQYPQPVKIVASPQAIINNTANGCTPLTVNFNAALSVADTSAINWVWNFGNGNQSQLQIPPAQLYVTAGTYTTQLIASNSTGCADTVTQTIEAYLIPTVSAGVDTMICKGTGRNLNATGATNYTWTPATGLSCTNCASPIATPDSATNYIVTGATVHGCTNIDTVNVKVIYPFVMNNSIGDTLCIGASVRLFATGANSYTWSPATGLSNSNSASPTASPITTTNYRVIGKDDKGCFSDTGFVLVKVYPIPTVEAGSNKTINAGQSVNLLPVISADITTITWTPTASIISNNFPAVTVKPAATTEYTIDVSNPGGCKSSDKVTVFVICNGANVFIPNTFSPNGDGTNDIFYPRGTGLFSIKTMRIFSRWGEVVFEKNNFSPNDAAAGWNGTFKGSKLTPDVYVYTIDIICDNSAILSFKGNIALIQ